MGSMIDAWVMKATILMGPRPVGRARGSTSKICGNNAAIGPLAQRRAASVGAGTIAGGASAGTPGYRAAGWRTSRSTAW